ncbi:MAG TPA: PAS domain-containing sensor histidine kinase [Burkholderiales bacterium]|nr:PAS domain-containing sensor histidine kinase [Burkholderiales bacterium]
MNDVTIAAAEAAATVAPRVLSTEDESEQGSSGPSEAGALLATLVEDIPTGVLVAYSPPEFPLVAVNRMAEALLGCSRHELLRLPAGSHAVGCGFAPSGATAPAGDRGLPLYRAAHLGQVLRDEEWTLLRRDGSRVIVLVNANPLRDSAGGIVGAITCLRDITPLKKLEQALRGTELRLREADHRKDQFLAILAHELRGPLAPVRNVVEILKVKAGNDSALAGLARILERQVGDMSRLLEDVLDLSRVTVGKLRLERCPIDLAPVIEHALEWSKPAITARRHRLNVSLPTRPVRVVGDAGRLAQVFSNLLTNAAKYTEPGGEITVSMQVGQDAAVIRVRDTGRGLEETDMQCLFDLFFQPDRTLDRAEGGLGIGLSLVRSLVQMHGGTVRAYSDGRGKGSEFVVTLPVLPDQARPEAS